MNQKGLLLWGLLSAGVCLAVWLTMFTPGDGTALAVERLAAPATELHVCQIGCEYTTIQAAVNAAQSGDLIKVAAGVYDDLVSQIVPPGHPITQIVYLDGKVLTIQGGYTSTDWSTYDPVGNQTILDGRGQGRAFYVNGGTMTLKGLYMTGGDAERGDATEAVGGSYGKGGSIYVQDASLTLEDTVIHGNTAVYGGGIYIISGAADLCQNTMMTNTAVYGGGVYFMDSTADLRQSTLTANTAGFGGALFANYAQMTIAQNNITANTAITQGGGGVIFQSDSVVIERNIVMDNIAPDGGGLYLNRSDVVLQNNVIADNRGTMVGGVYLYNSSPDMAHNTLVDNDVIGVYLTEDSQLAMANTIVASHTVGVSTTTGCYATLDTTLWQGNTENFQGNVTHQNDLIGDAAFVDANNGDYHIQADSTARDNGVDVGVSKDIDGDDRPRGSGYDVGADEFPDVLQVILQASPESVWPGEKVTYVIQVSRLEALPLHAVVTDTLPMHVSPTGVLTWRVVVSESEWTETVVVTVEEDYEGWLVNQVTAMTDDGYRGAATSRIRTVTFCYLPVLLRDS